MMNFKIIIFSVLLGLAYGGSIMTKLLPEEPFYPKLYHREKAILPVEEKLNPDDCNCRLASENRIIGGFKALKAIPWQVAIVGKTLKDGNEIWELLCSGVIANKFYVITEGVCMLHIEKEINRFKVVVNTYNLTEMNENDMYDIDDYEFRDIFSSEILPGDIGILKLKNPLKFSTGFVEPACLNLEKTLRYKEKFMVTGYGLITQTYDEFEEGTEETEEMLFKGMLHGKDSDILKKAYFHEDSTLKHPWDEELKKRFKLKDNYCDTYLICITSDKDESPCFHDNGGPIHYTKEGITKVEGLIGYYSEKEIDDTKNSLCNSPWFGVRLSYLGNWIESVVGDEYCKEPSKKEP